MHLPWTRRRVEASYTGYVIDSRGFIIGPDPTYSGKFYVKLNHILGCRNPSRFYLGEPPVGGVRYVYDTHKSGSPTDYYVTATGHFYGPDKHLPWFD
jgi:hypothetical protein